MAIIEPRRIAGSHRTGRLPDTITPEQVIAVLGFGPNVDDDPDKVTMSWGFAVDGHPCGIWDYYGNRWSVYDPDGVLPALFEPVSNAEFDRLASAAEDQHAAEA